MIRSLLAHRLRKYVLILLITEKLRSLNAFVAGITRSSLATWHTSLKKCRLPSGKFCKYLMQSDSVTGSVDSVNCYAKVVS